MAMALSYNYGVIKLFNGYKTLVGNYLKGIVMAQADKLTVENFEELVLNSSKPYLVDFWATWCQPCRALAPILDEIAQEHEAELGVGKVDIEANQELAARYHVLSIPTLLLFKDGKVVETLVGASPKATLMGKLRAHLD